MRNDSPEKPTTRALAIARGLVLIGQARLRDLSSGGFIRLIGGEVRPDGAPYFWVAHDGSKLLRSWPDHRDEILPDEFADDMACAGNSPAGRAVVLEPSGIPTPAEDPSLYDAFDYPYRPPGWSNSIRYAVPEHVQKLIAKRKAKREACADEESAAGDGADGRLRRSTGGAEQSG